MMLVGWLERMDLVTGMRRLCANDSFPQSMGALKHQWGSVDPLAPMVVVPLDALEKHGQLPRSNHGLTKKLSELEQDDIVVFISHRWLRPWQSLEEFLKFLQNATPEERALALADEDEVREYYSKGGQAHPDDAKGSKHKLVCAGVKQLAVEKGWPLPKVHVWLGESRVSVNWLLHAPGHI